MDAADLNLIWLEFEKHVTIYTGIRVRLQPDLGRFQKIFCPQNRTLYDKKYLELNKDLQCLGHIFHLGLPISLELTFLKSSLHLSHPASWSVCVPTHLSLSLSLCNNNHLPGETVGWWAGRVALCSPEWKWTEHSTDKLLLVWPCLHCCGSSHSGSLGPKYIML